MATRKKRAKPRARKAAGGAVAPDMLNDDPEGVQLITPGDPSPPNPDADIVVDEKTGTVILNDTDGSMVIDPTGQILMGHHLDEPDEDEEQHKGHDENLALKIDQSDLWAIAEEAMTGIDADRQDLGQFLQMRARSVEQLGMKLEDPKGDVSRSAMGMTVSSVRDPTMLQAVEFFRANAYNELCPAAGPVKVKITGTEEDPAKQDLADSLQADLNYYLTVTATEYYPDYYRMLWWTGLSSGTFKKVYYDPLRRRPVSEYVDAASLIISPNATDLQNAIRITHVIKMRKSAMIRMQRLGIYRKVMLQDPLAEIVNPVEEKMANVEGKSVHPQRPEDQEYTIYEVYCELNLRGFEHKERGKPTGLPLPYRVVIDETSREVLAIHRNWDADDEDFTAEIPFILFPYSTGLSSIYGSGIGQMGGNLAQALTALLRISIDNGMFGNFPASVKRKGPDRQLTNEIMAPPGGVVEIDTGGDPIQDFFMPLPYKDISGNVANFIEQLTNRFKELAGVANMPIGEGQADVPVGTILATIEQATKPMSATHKMLCAAQAEEFRKLVVLLKATPEVLWRLNRRPKLGAELETRLARFKQAMDDCDIEPQADPNVPSEMHRKLLALAMKQMTQDNPQYNQVEVDRYIFHRVFKMPDADFNRLLAAPQESQPDPVQMGLLRVKEQDSQTKRMQVQLTAQANKDKLQSQQNIEAAKLGQQHAQNFIQPQPTAVEQHAMAIKERQLAHEQDQLHFQAYDSHADREARQTEKAMDIASRLATHPESQMTVNTELEGLQKFLTPAHGEPQPPSNLSAGGRANWTPAHGQEALEQQMQRALAITAALQNITNARNTGAHHLQ